MVNIKGTYKLSRKGFEIDDVRALMLRRRLQILVHSYLYYNMNTNLISDQIWDLWAMELVQLQKDYPEVAKRVDYHKAFKGFDDTTGFDLPLGNPEIINKAIQLLNINNRGGSDGKHTNIERIRINLSGVR